MPRSRPSRILGTPSTRNFRKPICSRGHAANFMRHEPEGWVCLKCVDEYRKDHTESKSEGGVVLPAGSQTPRKDFVNTEHILGNRRDRRRMRKG